MLEQWEFNKLVPISQSAGKCFKNARLKRPSLSAAALPSLSVCRPSWNSKLYKKKKLVLRVLCKLLPYEHGQQQQRAPQFNMCCTHIYIYIYLCMYIFRIYLLSCCFYFPHSLRSVSPKTPHSSSIHRIPSAGSPHYYYYYYLFFFLFFPLCLWAFSGSQLFFFWRSFHVSFGPRALTRPAKAYLSIQGFKRYKKPF